MTDNLLTLVKKDLYKEWKSTNDIVEYNQNIYYHTTFSTEFRINNVYITDPIQIGKLFYNYFANIGLNLASNMYVHHNIQNFPDYLNKHSNIDFTFEPTS